MMMLRAVQLGCRRLSTSARVCAVQLKMPSLSPTMSEGTIVKWLKVGPVFRVQRIH